MTCPRLYSKWVMKFELEQESEPLFLHLQYYFHSQWILSVSGMKSNGKPGIVMFGIFNLYHRLVSDFLLSNPGEVSLDICFLWFVF